MAEDDAITAVHEIADTLRPTLLSMVEGRYGIAVSGSIGKKTNDSRSDFDFRLYFDTMVDGPQRKEGFGKVSRIIEVWRKKGREIDGVWPRGIADIDGQLKAWYEGSIDPKPLPWAVWGYYLPTDIHNQYIVEDPHGILKSWKTMLSEYPPTLKQAIIDRYLSFLRYWKNDYHYENKVIRRDSVFAFGLATKCIHAMFQIIFAVNEHHYVGDGKNMEYALAFPRIPDSFEDKVNSILYTAVNPEDLVAQRRSIVDLIEEVEMLVDTPIE